jgi:hypothetical protein
MVKGRRGNTDFGEIADARINGELDWSKINSEDDYKREVRDLLRNTPQDRDSGSGVNRAVNLLPFVDDLFRNSDASTRINNSKVARVKEQEDAFRSALRFERKRKLRERLRDESRTAKNTKPVNKRSVEIWKRRGMARRMDLRGIDTKLRRRATIAIITKAGEQKLRDKGIAISYDQRGFRHFRSMKSGKFVKAKF